VDAPSLATLIGATASTVTAIGGCVMAYAALVAARRKANDETRQELTEARPGPSGHGQLHKRKMSQA
jgi:hypothetical protein